MHTGPFETLAFVLTSGTCRGSIIKFEYRLFDNVVKKSSYARTAKLHQRSQMLIC